jgi:hypothetical protein
MNAPAAAAPALERRARSSGESIIETLPSTSTRTVIQSRAFRGKPND